SSRRRHTRSKRDWSSDVCSSDLRRRGDLLHLVWLWFAFASVQEGIAYLCLTPFGAGDTGQASQLLGLPVALQLVALALGVGGMFLNARAFAPRSEERRVGNGGRC